MAILSHSSPLLHPTFSPLPTSRMSTLVSIGTAHHDLVRSRRYTHEEPVLPAHVESLFPLLHLRHGMEQYLLPELSHFSFCGRPACIHHPPFAILIHRESVDDGCRLVHHERHHQGVRIYRLLDVGLRCVLQHSWSTRSRVALHLLTIPFVAEWYIWAALHVHLWLPSCNVSLTCLDWILLVDLEHDLSVAQHL